MPNENDKLESVLGGPSAEKARDYQITKAREFAQTHSLRFATASQTSGSIQTRSVTAVYLNQVQIKEVSTNKPRSGGTVPQPDLEQQNNDQQSVAKETSTAASGMSINSSATSNVGMSDKAKGKRKVVRFREVEEGRDEFT